MSSSHLDAERVRMLLEETLGWHRDDIEIFEDKTVHLKNLYDKIIIKLKNHQIADKYYA